MKMRPPTTNNSAGRLLAFFESIERSGQLWQILPRLIDPNSSLQNQLLEALPLGYELLGELQSAYEQLLEDLDMPPFIEGEREILLQGLAGLRETIYPVSLGNQFRQPSDAEKALLKVAGSRIPQEGKLTDDETGRIRDSIAELQKLVDKADLPRDLRKALLELIRLSQEALDRFNIRGARGLKSAWKQMVGESMDLFRTISPDKQKNDPLVLEALKTIREHLVVFDDIAARLMKIQPLLEDAARFLLPGC